MFPWGVNCRGGMIVLFCSFEMNALFYFFCGICLSSPSTPSPQKSNTFIRIFLLSHGVLFMFMFEEGHWSRWHGNRFCWACLRSSLPLHMPVPSIICISSSFFDSVVICGGQFCVTSSPSERIKTKYNHLQYTPAPMVDCRVQLSRF